MGAYYHLACRQCGQYLHFGKKLLKDNRDILQGLYSERSQNWISDERAWNATQSFLLEHVGHPLFFDHDEHDHSIDEYEEAELDRFLKQG